MFHSLSIKNKLQSAPLNFQKENLGDILIKFGKN